MLKMNRFVMLSGVSITCILRLPAVLISNQFAEGKVTLHEKSLVLPIYLVAQFLKRELEIPVPEVLISIIITFCL